MTERSKQPTGFKLRFSPDAVDRAEDVAGELTMPPILEEDSGLGSGRIVLDISYSDGEIERDADPTPYLKGT